MTARAVFISQTFSIYITDGSLEALLDGGSLVVPLYLGRRAVDEGQVEIRLVQGARWALKAARDNERALIDQAKAEFKRQSRRWHQEPEQAGGL